MNRHIHARFLAVLLIGAVFATACTDQPERGHRAIAVDMSDDGALRAALLDLGDRDRAAREALAEAMRDAEPTPGGGFTLSGDGAKAMAAVRAIDAESTAFLRHMVAERGWPAGSRVGEDGARAAWLLAQHADEDPAFQAEILALMEPLVARGEAEPRLFAMLTDRVRLARGEKQLYATQFANDDHGVMRPLPTEDWDTIDERRDAVGLPPLSEYAKTLSESYGEPADTTPID